MAQACEASRIAQHAPLLEAAAASSKASAPALDERTCTPFKPPLHPRGSRVNAMGVRNEARIFHKDSRKTASTRAQVHRNHRTRNRISRTLPRCASLRRTPSRTPSTILLARIRLSPTEILVIRALSLVSNAVRVATSNRREPLTRSRRTNATSAVMSDTWHAVVIPVPRSRQQMRTRRPPRTQSPRQDMALHKCSRRQWLVACASQTR